ncbi:EF-hand calcium-binding domain-containing protein 6-like [Uloborus diversus]|uniref:EF-hand calcium-binding domain-containing protein 6-like n=1 Tax=Uloborus diversus TaxID=327109 RepID=UPI0024091CDF|nr:EF-hand calcium-binding domain-containing protein 6-like [Uloborus diversus]
MKNFIRSMWLYDYNNDGRIQKAELETVLKNYCFNLSDDQFNRFWSLYDPGNNGVINYKEFLLKLGSRAESYKRIIPRRIKDQVEKNFPTVMRVLEIKDASNSGYVSQSVFHQVLNYFIMPTSDQLFKQILIYYKISPAATRIPWYTFLKSVCINSNVADQSNHSHILGSVSWNVCKSVIRKLKKNGKNSENFFKQSLTMPIQNAKMAITRAELRRTINQYLILPISEEEFRALMFILDPSHTNVIQCHDFLSLFDAIEEENGSQILKSQSIEENSPKTYANLSREKLRSEFKKCFNRNLKMILKAIDAFDCEETGAMQVNEMRNILEKFCFPLSDKQYYDIINNFPQISNKIFYHDFINHYRKSPYEDEEKWKSYVTKLAINNESPRIKLEFHEILNYIREVVHAHKEEFLKDFRDQDFCNKGIARKEVFFKLIQKYVFRLTDEQFKHLWDILPKNELGLIMYEDFLKQFDKQSSERISMKDPQAQAFVRRSSSSSLSKSKMKRYLSYKDEMKRLEDMLRDITTDEESINEEDEEINDDKIFSEHNSSSEDDLDSDEDLYESTDILSQNCYVGKDGTKWSKIKNRQNIPGSC